MSGWRWNQILGFVAVIGFVAGLTAAARGGSSGWDHSGYAEVLGRYVDGKGLVDYAGLKNDRSTLDQYLEGLAGVPDARVQRWSEAEKIAFWINAYNAFTLKAIIDHYPIKSGFFSSLVYPKNSIRQIDGVWDELRFAVKGEKLTLDHIEHQILRKQFDEPRIHVALVCAARSCPPLRNEPYTGARLEEQLTDQTRRFLARPENFSVDGSSRRPRLRLSRIFEWFGSDFVGKYGRTDRFPDQDPAVRAVLEYAWPHLSAEQRRALESGEFGVTYSDYDWTLNEE